jgi:hypothetical protein
MKRPEEKVNIPLKSRIEKARRDAGALEGLYRHALSAGEMGAFREAIAQFAGEYPQEELLSAWAYRLDVRPVSMPEDSRDKAQSRQWWVAVGTSVVLGLLFLAFAGDKPPMPIPSQSSPLFWIGWGPATALAILLYLAATDRRSEQAYWYLSSAAVVIIAALLTALLGWGRADAVANLLAIHLPFVCWAVVGVSVTFGYGGASSHFFGFLLKSVETIVTAGIYLIAGVIFAGLTYGIFAALGINLSETFLQNVASWGMGAIPILALASVYDPSSSPAKQNWTTGLARILRILTRLFLPLALGVLAVYVFWFIPSYFWRPFRERELLIVYNATIIAVIALLTCAVPGPEEYQSRYELPLRYALLSTGFLTVLLNVYALAAIVSRTLAGGLTPNRHAVLGWNVVTLLMLLFVTAKALLSGRDNWAEVYRGSMSRAMVLAVSWGFWVLFGLPFVHA